MSTKRENEKSTPSSPVRKDPRLGEKQLQGEEPLPPTQAKLPRNDREDEDTEVETPVGLINTGNQCYFIAALQCLCHLPCIENFFTSSAWIAIKQQMDAKTSITIAFSNMVEVLCLKSSSRVVSRTFKNLKKVVGQKYSAFGGKGQQDCDELIRILLTCLHTEIVPFRDQSNVFHVTSYDTKNLLWSSYMEDNGTVIAENFHSLTISSTTCDTCKNGVDEYVSESMLTLPIRLDVTEQLLSECLDDYKTLQYLPDSNWYCTVCLDLRLATHRVRILRAPDVLIFLLGRFTRDLKKIETPVRYPVKLDLRPWIYDETTTSSEMYQLCGVVKHHGAYSGGHYTNFIRKGRRWFYSDDPNVVPVDEADVMTDEAYLLLYEKTSLSSPEATATQGIFNESDVIELTALTFNARVVLCSELWVVVFYTPGCESCQEMAAEWRKAATALKDIVRIGAVDMTEHQSVGAPYGILGFPTIKVFGSDKQSPQDYQGLWTAEKIVDGALEHVKILVHERLTGKSGAKSDDDGDDQTASGDDKDVVELTDSNFAELVLDSDDLWLVEFYAPGCKHCKSLTPHWAHAASELKGKMKLGALDATVHTVMANQYRVRFHPTIKLFCADKKDGWAVAFDGGRTSDEIVAWVLDKLAENVPAPE